MRKLLLVVEWTVATAAAVVTTELALSILTMAVFGYLLILLMPLAGGVFVGLPLGLAQWLVLRRRVPDAGLWIVATVIGFGLAWIVAMVLTFAIFKTFSAVAFAIATPLIGLAQARVLGRWSSHTMRWMIASTVGWTACVFATQLFPTAFPAVTARGARLVGRIAHMTVSGQTGPALLGGLVAGAITGAALVTAIRRND